MAKSSSSKFVPPRTEESDSESDYSSSSDDVSEDEFGEELTPALDAAILQTLGRIKRKEGVYGAENVLQEALKEAEKRAGSLGVQSLKRVVADKPYLLADHHRAALLGEGMDVEDPEVPLTNVQEQRKLRAGAISAFHSLAGEEEEEDDAEEEDGFVLRARAKNEGELANDDEEYRRFLLEMGGGEEEVRKILGMGDAPAWKPDEQLAEGVAGPEKKKSKKESALSKVEKEEVKREHQDKKEKADDDFLMNYILNRGWIDRSEQHVPTYDEVVANVKEEADEEEDVETKPGQSSSHPWGVLEEDDFDEKAEEFENAYNFRYEEPGSSNILTHPREIPSLVRRTDDARKLKRQAREERKAAEKAAEEEKTRRLKGAKRREMEAHIEALKAELGEGLDYTSLEGILEGDFDEEEWDRVVGEIMDQAAEQEEKPAWGDIGDAEYDEADGEGGDYDSYAYNMDIFAGEADEEDDGPINMDADFAEEQPKKKSKKDKKSKKGKEREVDVEDGLSVAARAEKVKQTIGEYRALDHEDMIEGLPTRFKYTQSAPIDFGLSPVEILLATDAELNGLAAMKHLAPYKRGGGMGRAAQGLNRRIRDLKRTLQARRWGEEGGEEQEESREPGSGSNAGPTGVKRKWGESGESGESAQGQEGTKKSANGSAGGQKRLGKKQRQKAKLAAEAEAAARGETIPAATPIATPASSAPQASGEVVGNGNEGGAQDGEGKKKRRKKKKGGVANGEVEV